MYKSQRTLKNVPQQPVSPKRSLQVVEPQGVLQCWSMWKAKIDKTNNLKLSIENEQWVDPVETFGVVSLRIWHHITIMATSQLHFQANENVKLAGHSL